MARKGFPESYDVRDLMRFLAELKAGAAEVHAPRYSHLTYDIVPDEEIILRSPDIVIVEGVNVLQTPSAAGAGRGERRRLRLLRLLDLRRRRPRQISNAGTSTGCCCCARRRCTIPARTSTSSRSTTEEATREFAKSVWTQVNLVNLRENIAPTRGRAHLVLEKGRDHAVGRGSGCASSERQSRYESPVGRRAPHAAQAEPRELGRSTRASCSASTSAFGSWSAVRPTDSAMPTIALASTCRCSSAAGISISVAIVSAAASRISSTMRGELGIGAQRRAEQEQERGAVADREPEVGAEPELDPLAHRARPAGGLRERAEQLAAGLFEQLDVQRALAREVLVQHGLGDARALRRSRPSTSRGSPAAANRSRATSKSCWRR